MKKAKRNPIEWHHTIPVAANVDWHLRNLWDGGWTCVKPMKVEDHIKYHATRSKKAK